MLRGLRSKLTFLVVLALLAQTIPAGAVQPSGRTHDPSQQVVTPAEPKTPKAEKPKAVDPAWDPKDPAAVQYSDGAWGIVYNDNANPANLIFRRSLGGADPQYWRDPIKVEAGADRPAMVTLGGTTAVFFRKTAGTVKEIFLKTSTDDGATWSAATI